MAVCVLVPFVTSLRRPTEPETATPPVDHAHYYRRVLHELIDMGTDLARTVHRQALAAPAPEPAPAGADPAVAFDRIARCIRRSIALARTLDDPASLPPATSPINAAQRRIAARRRIIRGVEDAIQRHPGDGQSLYAELLDRLDGPDLDDDIDGRPIADIIVDICRDLGIAALPGTQPWKRRTPADIATLYAHAAQRYGPAGDGATLQLNSARFRGK